MCQSTQYLCKTKPKTSHDPPRLKSGLFYSSSQTHDQQIYLKLVELHHETINISMSEDPNSANTSARTKQTTPVSLLELCEPFAFFRILTTTKLHHVDSTIHRQFLQNTLLYARTQRVNFVSQKKEKIHAFG